MVGGAFEQAFQFITSGYQAVVGEQAFSQRQSKVEVFGRPLDGLLVGAISLLVIAAFLIALGSTLPQASHLFVCERIGIVSRRGRRRRASRQACPAQRMLRSFIDQRQVIG